ncbi:hypothetical protein H072_11348 [Dactylellina haptotyla CBS 200.50]|uniref:Uncharacterized protein n=1 Tax=Dactylellina haptotyla (strain CBS 200.50) TaxID=1284197 RepID=S7ZX46_DACHA|nr:hypothetical protein H072_11348 [Dactylellina haptotyla CBS 200.50]
MGKIEKLKDGIVRLISSMRTFRNALEGTRLYFNQTVYTAPTTDLVNYHPLVFATTITLHTQTRITAQASKLIQYVRRTHWDREANIWDDEDLRKLIRDLRRQITKCEEEANVMLEEMGSMFTVQVKIYEEEGDTEESFETSLLFPAGSPSVTTLFNSRHYRPRL